MKASKSQIRVAHLIGSTGLYGAERWVLALMRAMDGEKFRSILVNLADSDQERSVVVNAARDRGLEAFDFVTGGRFNFMAAVRLARWAREQGIDIIHGHGYKSDLVGLLAAKIAGCRVITTPHGWSVEKDLKLNLYEKLDRYLFRFMDMVCPLSEQLYRDTSSTAKDARLIPNGVDIDEIRSAEALAYPAAMHVVGYIGRLVKAKDLATLLDAVGHLTASQRRVKLVVVGDGDHAAELKEISKFLGLKDVVDFTGFRSDTGRFLRGFNSFVLPSLSEGTPRCIMEAMALSVPVIASDIPGNRLLVSHQETGLLFPVGDSRKLAECIAFMMDRPDEAQRLALNACKKVEEQFSSRKMAWEYAVVYRDLVPMESAALDAKA